MKSVRSAADARQDGKHLQGDNLPQQNVRHGEHSQEEQISEGKEQQRKQCAGRLAYHELDSEGAVSIAGHLPRCSTLEEEPSADHLSKVEQKQRPSGERAGETAQASITGVGNERQWSGGGVANCINRVDIQKLSPSPEGFSVKQVNGRGAPAGWDSPCSSTFKERSAIFCNSGEGAPSEYVDGGTPGAAGRCEDLVSYAYTCTSPHSGTYRQIRDRGRALGGGGDLARDVQLGGGGAQGVPNEEFPVALNSGADAEASASAGVRVPTTPVDQAAAKSLHGTAGALRDSQATSPGPVTTATGSAKETRVCAEKRGLTGWGASEMCDSSVPRDSRGMWADYKGSTLLVDEGQQPEHGEEQKQQREAEKEQLQSGKKQLHQQSRRLMSGSSIHSRLDVDSEAEMAAQRDVHAVKDTADPSSSTAARCSNASRIRAEEASAVPSTPVREAGGTTTLLLKSAAGTPAVSAATEVQAGTSLDQHVGAILAAGTVEADVRSATLWSTAERPQGSALRQAPELPPAASESLHHSARRAATRAESTVGSLAPGLAISRTPASVIMSTACCSSESAFAGEERTLQSYTTSGDRYGGSVRRTFPRNAIVAGTASATSSVAAVGVTQCSPLHVKIYDGFVAGAHQQQPRGSAVPPPGVGAPLAAAACTPLFSSAARPTGASSGSHASKNISLKRKACTSSGKNRSSAGRCNSNATRKAADTTSIRFDASWFLPQDGWSHWDDPSSFRGRFRKRLKCSRKEDEAAAGKIFPPLTPSPHFPHFEPTKKGMYVRASGELQPDNVSEGSIMALEAAESAQSIILRVNTLAPGSDRTVGEETSHSSSHLCESVELNRRCVDGDSVLVSPCDSEEEELDVYLSDVEAAARALDDPLSPARRLQPYERPRCCVCRLPLRPVFSNSKKADPDSRSSAGRGNTLTIGFSDSRGNGVGSAAWEPLCVCMPRPFGENTLQGRAAKDSLLFPPAATPLQYTVHTLLLKQPLLSDKCVSLNNSNHAATSSGGSLDGDGYPSGGGSSSADGNCTGRNNLQSSGSGPISSKTRQEGSSSAQASSRIRIQRNSSCDRDGSIPNESGSSCSSNCTWDSSEFVVETSGKLGIEWSKCNTVHKVHKRFCRWRDLATLQNFCAPLEQLQDSLAATVASAAAAGAAAGRPVVYLPRLFWDRETDCYVASCLGYCREASSSSLSSDNSSGAISVQSGITVADADIDLRLLQKRFSVGFLGDAKAHFYACMWLNWHYEQANAIQRKQQQQRQDAMEQHHQQLHPGGGRSGAISEPTAGGQLRKQSDLSLTSVSLTNFQKTGHRYGEATAASLWKQQKQSTDAADTEDETEEERKARLRQESLARQKRHKLERQQWRRQQARLARLLQQQQQEQPHQQQRHSPKQHAQQQNQQEPRQHVSCAAVPRAASAVCEQASCLASIQESRITRASSYSSSLHSQQQQSPGDAAPTSSSTRAAAGAMADRTAQQTGKGFALSSSGRKTEVYIAAGANPLTTIPRETPGGGSSTRGNALALVEHRTVFALDACHSAGDTVNRGAISHYNTAAGVLQVPPCNAPVVGSRLHRRSDGTQTPPLARGCNRDYCGASSRSQSSTKANRASSPRCISQSSGGSSTNKGNIRNHSSGSVMSSTSSRGGTSVMQNNRNGTVRGGLLKQDSSNFASSVVGKGAADSAAGQTTHGAAGTGCSPSGGTETFAAPCGRQSAVFQSDAGEVSAVNSPGPGSAASAAGGSRRAGESNTTELACSTAVSTDVAGGKAKGRINARKCAATTKAASTVSEKQLSTKAKTRCPPLSAAAAAALSAVTASAPTIVADATAATLATPSSTMSASAASKTPDYSSTAHTSTNAGQTRGAARAAASASTASRPDSHCMPGTEPVLAVGDYREPEEVSAVGDDRDTPAPSNGIESVERRCRAARTSPRCLYSATGVIVSGGATPTRDSAGLGDGAASAVVVEEEKGNVAQSAYASVPSMSSPACICVATAESSISAVVGAVNSSRGGTNRGRGSGAAILGTPEKLKISTRAQQRSVGSTTASVAPVGPCSGGNSDLSASQQQGQLRGERAAVTFALEASVGWKSAAKSPGGASRVAAISESSTDTECGAGLTSSPHPGEETRTARAAHAGRTATTPTATFLGGIAGGEAATSTTKGQAKSWKNCGNLAGEDRRWAASVRQRQSRRHRETRR